MYLENLRDIDQFCQCKWTALYGASYCSKDEVFPTRSGDQHFSPRMLYNPGPLITATERYSIVVSVHMKPGLYTHAWQKVPGYFVQRKCPSCFEVRAIGRMHRYESKNPHFVRPNILFTNRGASAMAPFINTLQRRELQSAVTRKRIWIYSSAWDWLITRCRAPH